MSKADDYYYRSNYPITTDFVLNRRIQDAIIRAYKAGHRKGAAAARAKLGRGDPK